MQPVASIWEISAITALFDILALWLSLFLRKIQHRQTNTRQNRLMKKEDWFPVHLVFEKDL